MLAIAHKNPMNIDEEILRLIKDDNLKEQGYRLLIRTYQVRLYHHIRNLVKTHEDTDDVLQNVLIKVCRSIDKFEQKSTLFTWMYTIATRESFDFLAREKRKTENESSIGKVNNLAGSESDLDGNKLENLIEKAISSLPDKQRLVFHLRYYDELPYDQIAEITGTSTGALKASYHHAVKKIESIILERYE